MKKQPKGLEYIGNIMSNFDHAIDDGAEEKLKSGDFYGTYTAWNFHATVWFDSGKFNCQVRQFHAHVDTIEADNLSEIMEQVSQEYGAE